MSGRVERTALALALCLPVPLLAASGLAVPLPGIVERVAAALVPFASADALLADTASASGRAGSIMTVHGRHPDGDDAAAHVRLAVGTEREPAGRSRRNGSGGTDTVSPATTEETPSPRPPVAGADEQDNAPKPPDSGPTHPAGEPKDTPTAEPDAPSEEADVPPNEPDTKPKEEPAEPTEPTRPNDPDPTPRDEPDPTPKDEPDSGAIDVPIVGPVDPPPLPPAELPDDPTLEPPKLPLDDPPKLPPIGLPLGP